MGEGRAYLSTPETAMPAPGTVCVHTGNHPSLQPQSGMQLQGLWPGRTTVQPETHTSGLVGQGTVAGLLMATCSW